MGCTEPSKEAAAQLGCNGHERLCSAALDEVTFAGTHNSMANFDADWLAANQQHGITRQLQDGIRALMLDTVEWNGEPYLCHGYCDLGAQRLDEGLAEIEDFLAANPREVVIIVFQDGLTRDVMTSSLEESGLGQRAWTWEGSLPTLGELIDQDTRLIVSSEHHEPPPGWYHHAWDLIQDTPYSFESEEDMDCALFRGTVDGPLFLMNHWVGTPLPTESGAAVVNSIDVLGPRAAQCERERDRRINIIAVDFYNRGDLFEVVSQLNGTD